jgi:hypothetical protein
MTTPDQEIVRALRELVARQLNRSLSAEEEQGLEKLLRRVPPPAPRHDLKAMAQQQIMQALDQGKEKIDSTMRQVSESMRLISSEALGLLPNDELLAMNWLEALRNAAQAPAGLPVGGGTQQITALITAEVERQVRLAMAPIVQEFEKFVARTTAAPAAGTTTPPPSQTAG